MGSVSKHTSAGAFPFGFDFVEADEDDDFTGALEDEDLPEESAD